MTMIDLSIPRLKAMSAVRSYQDLRVWQQGMILVQHACNLADRLPRHQFYGLRSQIERAAYSVPANIAEGFGRDHLGDYLRHLSIANGSLKELETLLLIASQRRYLGDAEIETALARTAELGRMLSTLVKRLKQVRFNRVRPGPTT